MSIFKRSLTFVFATIAALVIFAQCHEAAAQDYQGLEMPDVYFLTQRPYRPTQDTNEIKRKFLTELRQWKKEGDNPQAISAIRTGQAKVKEVLAAGGDVTTDADAQKFLEEYTFPSMTQTDPDTLSSFGQKREDFLKNYLHARITGSARNKMLDFSIQKLQDYSTDATLHPSARVNAVVLLSQLTDRALARDQAPIASASAFKALLNIYSNDDPKQSPEFIKVAAMSGIKHQLEMNSKSGQTVPAAVKTQLVDTAMQLMAAPADREQDAAAYWKKRQAVQLAAILKDAKTLPALLAILNDENASHELKLEVVRTIAKTGAMNTDAKINSDALVAICKFAESAIANEATGLQASVDQLVRDGILYADDDIRAKGIDFEPSEEPAGGGFGGGGFGGGFGAASAQANVAMIELPNYQLQIVRNRIRAVSMFCQQAIGASKQDGLRPNLDTKADTLASSTVSQLKTLLNRSGLGLYDLTARRRSDQPTPQELDQQRRTSYVDQMTRLCQVSSEAITKQLESYTAE